MYFMYCTFRSTGINQAKHRAEACGSPEEDEHGLLEELSEAQETECSVSRGRCGPDWTVEAVEAMARAFHVSPGGRGNPF